MAALLDSRGISRAVVGGLSLGGYLSLTFYLAHPERVAALMLFDTGPGFRNDQARQEWNDRAIATAERFERDGLSASQVPLHDSASGLARAARGMLTQHDAKIIESLPLITVPVLVLVGARDRAFLGAADYVAAKIPGARRSVIPDAGHTANSDAPELFNQAVVNFLAWLGER
jgi:pimeloyl-ACP methyl ester carboxylesterase